ncbi:extensin-like domain-containing protein [Sphingomonas qomolangmaensis]|uniref:Extensin family protein n=1 Tax=Sphingomonas qomolangmaensis TaxID=2918765 RepID=A0ABY5L341_9SPHN|nr:extensin family protein [Sphingomonas qomolangmaensis]UUL81365.1 extensin family protein [Sphingomonas qomolangmaensis]
MIAVRRIIGSVAIAAILLAIAFALFAFVRSRPQDMPWTELDLGQPVGMFTRGKLVGLREDFATCRGLLDRAGIEYTALAPVSAGQCGYSDGIRFTDGGARRIEFSPSNLGVSCPVAAALAMWEWNVVQPAAQRHFGSRVTRIDHLGSYNCRRLYGRDEGDFSEHATANAVDIAGFRTAQGDRISVLNDWDDSAAKGAFLREVRDGGCDLFATVLSPDYNAAHRDHFHFDQANRGAGWGACR